MALAPKPLFPSTTYNPSQFEQPPIALVRSKIPTVFLLPFANQNYVISSLKELAQGYSFGAVGNVSQGVVPPFTVTLPNPDTDGYVFSYERHTTGTTNVYRITTSGGADVMRGTYNGAPTQHVDTTGPARLYFISCSGFWMLALGMR